METAEKEKIRKVVRERYGQIAGSGSGKSGGEAPSGCCAPTGAAGTDDAASCCGTSCCTPEGLSTLTGYSKQELESVPEGSNMGLGCGNPVALASLAQGETVVDLGSGGGFDCFLAARQVGDSGRVIGIDMTPDMVAKARLNAEKSGATNVSFRLGEIEHMPVADNTADILMSNCVINLSPDKPAVYREAFRVLKPGGRIAVSDILATAPLSEEIRKNLELYAACIGGAATIDDTRQMLEQAGFADIRIEPRKDSRKLIQACAPDASDCDCDCVVSANIAAVKPN